MKCADTLPIVRRGHRPRRIVLFLAAAAIALGLTPSAGCANGASPDTTQGQVGTTTGTIPTSPSGEPMTTVTYSPPYTGTTKPGVPLSPFESNALALELKRTSAAIGKVAGALEAEGAPAGDPRSGTVFALRARAQAITARRAIVDGQLPLADEAVKQLGRLLAEAARTAEGDTATALTKAQEHMALMAFPSQATLQAASVLDQVIRDLGPLVPDESPPAS
ncbi:MAG: hypothetical protein ACYC5Q_07785 [Thermoleophilia bacterium]|jgi:hypothetical protein